MGGESILVVEDMVVTARHIQSTLMGLGYDVEHLAMSGEEAIAKALENKPDLILMDIMLGEGMDGVQTAQSVRSHMDVPIVFLSASSDKSILDRAKMAEPFGYLMKPFRPEELRTTIEVALFKHKMEVRLRESEQKYRDLVELLPHFVFEIDGTGRFSFVNEKGLKLSGYNQQDVVDGTGLLDVLAPEDSERAAEDIERVLNGATVVEREYTLIKKDGGVVPVLAHAAPIAKNASVIGIRGAAIDISQIKAAKEMLQDAAATLEKEVEDRTKEMKRQLEQLKALNTLSLQVSSSLSLPMVLTSTRDLLVSVLQPELALIFLVQGDELIFQDTQAEGSKAVLFPEQAHRIGRCLCGLAASEKIPVYSIDIQKDPRCTMDECKNAGVKSFAALPLKTGDSLVGVLGLASRSERDFSKESIFLETASAQAAMAIHNARLYEQAEQHGIELEKKIDELQKSRLALQKSEDLLSKSQEIAHVGSWQFELTTRRLICSDEACRIFGVQPQEFSGSLDDFVELVHPDDLASVEAAYSGSLRESEGSHEVEHRIVLKDSGEVRHLHEKWEHVRDSSGRSIRVVGMVQDITDRTNVEEALREAHDIISRSPAVAFRWKNEEGWPVDFVTDNVEELFGLSADNFMSGRVAYSETIHPEDLDRVAAEVADHSAEQELERFVHRSYRIVTNVGEVKWVDDRTYMKRDSTGRITHYEGIVQDVTAREGAENELARAQALLLAAIEQSPAGILIADAPDVRIRVANPAALGMWGSSAADMTNISVIEHMRWRQTYHWNGTPYDPTELPLSRAVLQGETSRDVEVILRDPQGRDHYVLANAAPVSNERGEIVAGVVVFYDVSERRKAEQERLDLERQLLHAQKLESLGVLAGGIAHDFNNLLQAILGYSELILMKKGPGDPDCKRLGVIQQAARDGADLVSRILTFSRKVESRVRPIDLNEQILKAQELLRRTVPRMIDIELVLAEDLQIIDADAAQVEQVLLNLAINAQHAMPDGGRILIETSNVSLSDEYLRTHLGAKPGHYVLLTVSDTGVGIDPEVLERIFEPFFTTKTSGEGTGLGLAMAHGIISQHGGYIRCYSEPGRGTSFKIYFPVSASEFLSEDLTLTREMPAFGTETILMVDDDDRVREMGREMMEMAGYSVLTACNGEEALERYAALRDEIDIVILDLIMPGMGGKRCLEELLRIDPHVRVVLASGFSSTGLDHELEGGGGRGFISKPYDSKEILGAIRTVLDRGQL